MRFAPGRAFALAIAFALAAVAVEIAFAYHHRSSIPPVTYAGTPIVPPKPVDDFILTAGDGRSAHLLGDTPLEFLFFGYTHCPDECPLAMASLARAYRILPATSRVRTRVVFVTVDPARDSPRVLKRYLAAFDPHFIGLTGSAKQLRRVWRAYGVEVEPVTKEIGHGDSIYAIGTHARVLLIYAPNAAAADLASDALKLTR